MIEFSGQLIDYLWVAEDVTRDRAKRQQDGDDRKSQDQRLFYQALAFWRGSYSSLSHPLSGRKYLLLKISYRKLWLPSRVLGY
jgi:hypothetical protein